MQEININVRVQLGLTDNLFSVLSAIAARCVTPAPTAQTPVVETPVAQEPVVETPVVETPVVETPTAQTPVVETPVVETPVAPTCEKEYTVVDVREAMNRTRRRIEGEDYKENTDSANYKKWHRALTSWFKNSATAYGAEIPSAIPDSDSRAAFINECDALTIKNDTLFTEIPF